jgi:acyl-CoA synthetase (AMP-forming)/AMP-acid ligase II
LNQSLRLAAVFQKIGVQKEDSIGIISENNWENYVVILATLFIGATIAPINPTYIESEYTIFSYINM